jgi:hypothetical protein
MIRTHRRFVFLMAAAWMLAGQPSPFTNPAAQSLKSTTICPTPTQNSKTNSQEPYWPQGMTVYYDGVTNVPDSTLQSAITSAFKSWNKANSGNGSNVNFQPSGAGHTANYIWYEEATSILEPGDVAPAATLFANGAYNPTSSQITGTIETAVDARNAGGTWFNTSPSASPPYLTALLKVCLHEIGHTMGLIDQPSNPSLTCGGETPAGSVMNQLCGINDSGGNLPTSPTNCDNTGVSSVPGYQPNAVVCTAPPTCGGSEGGVLDGATCQCQQSPVIIDVLGTGFELTDAAGGVTFDLADSGTPGKFAWTEAGSANAFLCLDRNGNGRIDNGSELFGNVTAQPASPTPNGFAALAVFDLPENGGNGDGIIDSRDAVFSKLLLWQDLNHNGISEPWELHSLPSLGVAAISLNYQVSWLRDQFGNWFHYRSLILDEVGQHDGRWAYDVFLDEQR